MPNQKKLIEDAYTLGPSMGLDAWCHDQAGPYQTVPQPGESWQQEGKPARHPSEYVRNGTAKFLTMFHPADGRVSIEGVATCPNSVLHPWLKQELSSALAGLPTPSAETTREEWERWQEGLSVRFTLPEKLPPLRMLLILDNLAGHKTPEFVLWLVSQGIMPLFIPLWVAHGSIWLNRSSAFSSDARSRVSIPKHPSRSWSGLSK